MKRETMIIALCLAVATMALAQNVNVKANFVDGDMVFETTAGDDIMVITDDHDVEIPSGSVLDIESGGALEFAGVAITATAAQLNSLATLEAFTADTGGVAANDIAYVSGYDSTNSQIKLKKAQANALATMQDLYWCPTAVTAAATGTARRHGVFTSTLTNSGAVGTPVYLSAASAGLSTGTLPTGANYVKEIGSFVTTGATAKVHVDLGGEEILTHTHADASQGGTLSTPALTGTTSTAFEVDSDGSIPAVALGVGTTGDFTQTIKPAATLTTGDAVITIPDTASVAGVFVLEDTSQTLTNKTLTTPTIGDLTNATHDHSDNANGGIISTTASTGTTHTSFEVDSDGSIPATALGVGTTGDYTQTIAPAATLTTGDATIRIPDTAGAAGVFVLEGSSQTLGSKTLTNPHLAGGAVTLDAAVTVTGTWTDLGTVTTADVNGGTIDGVTIGAAAAPTVTNLGTVTTMDVNGGTLDAVIIGGAAAAAAEVTTLGATDATIETIAVDDATTPTIALATGKTNTGTITVNGKTSGSLIVTTNDSTAYAVTLTPAAQTTGAATVTIPDMANTSASFVMTETAQTVNGVKTFGSNPVLPGVDAADSTLALTGKVGASSAGGVITATSGAGHGAGNAGGAITVTTGAGVAAAGATGGASGAIGLVSGAAGTETTGQAGASGAISLTTAAGGLASGAAGLGGDSGAITLTTGTGGTASGGTGDTGGDGGAITLAAGTGGAGDTAQGDGGSVAITAGAGDTNGTITLGGTNASALAIGRTGVVTSIHGTLTANDATTPAITTAAGKTNAGYVSVLAKTSGGLKLICNTDATGNLAILTPAAQGQESTITIPDPGAATASVVLNKGTNTISSADTHTGTLDVSGATVVYRAIVNADVSASAAIVRSKLAQDALAVYTVPLTDFKQTSDLTALPASGDETDMGLVAGAHGTASPSLNADTGAGGTSTEKARVLFVLPAEYDAGETVTLRLHARCSDLATTSATIDAEVYESDTELGVSADLCETVAQSIHSTSWADKDFTITPTALVAGDLLDIELTVVFDDAGGGGDGAVAAVGAVEMLLDIQG